MLKKAGEKAVVVCSNGMVAAWHPKQPFPYEHSRPINIKDVNRDREKYFALLNGQRNPRNSRLGKDGPRRIDLREMFYTVSQEWCPRYRETRLYQMCFFCPPCSLCHSRVTSRLQCKMVFYLTYKMDTKAIIKHVLQQNTTFPKVVDLLEGVNTYDLSEMYRRIRSSYGMVSEGSTRAKLMVLVDMTDTDGSNRIAFGKHKTMALWTQHFSVNGFAIPSTRGLFSSVLLLFLALQLLSTTQMTQVSAMPNNRIYYAVFREDDVQAFPYYRLFSQETMPKVAAGLEKRNPPLVIGKKYDRNCFFSPVACMLAKHGNHLDEAIWNGNGRK